MKKLMIITLALASVFTSASAQLLYKISGKDLKAPSYIVGTYHLAPVSFVNAIEGIPDALTNTDQVCGELDMDDMKKPESTQKMAAAMLLPYGKTLKSMLTEDEYTRLNKLLKDLTSADMSNPIVEAKFGNITPQALNTQLSLLMSLKHARGFDPTQSFDDYFQKFAKRNHEPVIGLETVDKQIEVLFKSIPLERQKQLLMCLVDNTVYYNMVTQRLSDAYFAQNMKQIEEILNEKRNDSCDDTKEEYAIMFDNRNADWAAKMPAIMSDKPTFFAVGAGHLPGEKGLLNLLKQAGYEVEAVK